LSYLLRVFDPITFLIVPNTTSVVSIAEGDQIGRKSVRTRKRKTLSWKLLARTAREAEVVVQPRLPVWKRGSDGGNNGSRSFALRRDLPGGMVFRSRMTILQAQ
jgi:hypothetical protein